MQPTKLELVYESQPIAQFLILKDGTAIAGSNSLIAILRELSDVVSKLKKQQIHITVDLKTKV